jgi:hypothetical protein
MRTWPKKTGMTASASGPRSSATAPQVALVNLSEGGPVGEDDVVLIREDDQFRIHALHAVIDLGDGAVRQAA